MARGDGDEGAWVGLGLGVMKSVGLSTLLFLTSATMLHGAVNQSCVKGSDAASILHVHGRLTVYNGGYPNLRLWQVGTHHLFGVFSDPADLQCIRRYVCGGEEDTKLPDRLDRLDLLHSMVYGDFEIRLLKPLRQGRMQAVCIVDVEKMVVIRDK